MTAPDASSGTDSGADQSLDSGATGQNRGGASIAYRAVMITILGLGGIAVMAGLAGTFVVLTGGLDDGEEFDVLGGFDCETFDSDPQVVHDADYAVERQVLTPTEVAVFDGTVTDDGVEIVLETDGVFLDASANEPDGTPIPVQTHENGVVVERDTTEPFRLWVDSVAEDGTVTRMQLDLCSPVGDVADA